jgi:GntR family transcriptional regulator/MocR family aminotransferase
MSTPPLRHAIAQHLQASRFVNCDSSQVVVTSGSQQSLDLIARLTIDRGDAVWMEEPGYIGATNVWRAAGARIAAVPVDRHGLDIAAGRALEPRPRVIFVSPSRQYPLGMTLSLQRRSELLEFASKVGAWIVEDDYDSEFRYQGHPLPAMQSQDPGGRVIYLGTFSKSLLPSFRLGYMVLPRPLVSSFVTAKTIVDRHPPLLEQMTLHEFMSTGQFAAHVRKMRALYLERQTTLIEQLAEKLPDLIDVAPAETGMHLVGFFKTPIDDVAFSEAADRRGVSVRPLSIYYLGEQKRSGLILGFAAIPGSRIPAGVDRLASVARDFMAGTRQPTSIAAQPAPLRFPG